MNDLLSRVFSKSEGHDSGIEMSSENSNLEKLFEEVKKVEEDLNEIDVIQRRLKDEHERSKTLHTSRAVKELRAQMDRDVGAALKKARTVKKRLEDLGRMAGSGGGGAEERARETVVTGLKKRVGERMEEFRRLRERIGEEYRETVQRRYFTITGENPDEKTLDLLISTGESETFLQKAIQEQGRGQVEDIITEIRERHDAVMDIEKNLAELHQVFLDMQVLVNSQGQQLDDIESNLGRAHSYVRDGAGHLQVARKHQKSTRKWACIGTIVLVLIILLIVLFTVKPWQN